MHTWADEYFCIVPTLRVFKPTAIVRILVLVLEPLKAHTAYWRIHSGRSISLLDSLIVGFC